MISVLREACFLQRGFLRVAPQVKGDHQDIKAIVSENKDLCMSGKGISDDVSEDCEFKCHVTAMTCVLELFGYTALGRFASDDDVPTHVAKFAAAAKEQIE